MSRVSAVMDVRPETRALPQFAQVHKINSFHCDAFKERVTSRPCDVARTLNILRMYHEGEEKVAESEYSFSKRDANSIFLSSRSSYANSSVPEGELRYRRLLRVAEEIIDAQLTLPPSQRIYPTPAQRRGLKKNLQRVAPLVYGTDWERCQEKYLIECGLDRLCKRGLDMRARRRGKTTGLTLLIAVLCVSNIPGSLNVRYYSQSVATCQSAQDKILRWLLPYFNVKGINGKKCITHQRKMPPYLRVVPQSEAEMGRNKSGTGNYVQVQFAACNDDHAAKTLRGQDVDVAVADEIAFLSHDIMTKDIAVHDIMKKTALIFATTPLDEENIASILLDVRDKEGRLMFDLAYEAGACAECIAAKKADSCYHQLDGVPDHLSTDNQLQKALMSEEEYDQETQAIITTVGRRAFSDNMVYDSEGSFMCLPRYNTPQHVPVVFLGIDPTGGSLTSSDFAVSAMYCTADFTMVICGLLAASVDDHLDEEKAFRLFMRALRKNPSFERSVFIPIIEVNLKINARHILNYMIPELGPFHFATFGSNNTIGPLTKIDDKLDWVHTARFYMGHRSLRFADQVVTVTAKQRNVHVTLNSRELFEELKNQMLGYKFYKTPTGKDTTNGKNGNRTKDDLIDAVFIALSHSISFNQDGNPANRELRTNTLDKLGYELFPS